MTNYNDAGNYKEPRLTTKPVNVVLFVSRNKDNQLVDGFQQRRQSFLTTWAPDDPRLHTLFSQFVKQGLDKEMSRFYISVNERDNAKIERTVIHYLVDHPDVNMANLRALTAWMAMNKENAVQKRRMFDFDIDEQKRVNEFIADLLKRGADEKTLEVKKTPHGYYVVIERGVDLRGLVDTMPDVKLDLKKDKGPWKWSDQEVTYKIDDLKLVSWLTN